MTIDINRRLLVWYGYINILNTITQLNDQLPICIMNEVKRNNLFFCFYFNCSFSIC
jgi:hypothetical protein